jgi:hypothetical protein
MKKFIEVIVWIINKVSRNTKLLITAEDEFPEGLAQFKAATWKTYTAASGSYGLTSPGDNSVPKLWANYAAFLNQAWYEDGLIAWKNLAWRSEPSFKTAYSSAEEQAGVDYHISWRTHVALWAADLASCAAGNFVELGTGRGWMASAILSSGVVKEDVKFFLFDTFDIHNVDSNSGNRLTTQSPVYAESPAVLNTLINRFPNVVPIVGNVLDTVGPNLSTIQKIAFLHVDLNAAIPEEESFRKLFPLLSSGSVVLLDDYGFLGLESQRDSWDHLAKEFSFNIMSLPTGQGLFVIC